SGIARDLLSYIKCTTIDGDMPLMQNQDIINIINKPYRGIGRHVIAENEYGFQELLKVYEKSCEVTDNIKNFMFHLKMIGRLDPYGAINYIYYGAGYEDYLKEYAQSNNLNYAELKKNFDTIWRESANYKSIDAWVRYVERQMNVESKAESERGNVNLLTMHASKGLEYKVVFIPDSNQGVIPEARALREYDVDEERRLFFVAMTRAADKLHIYYNKCVMGRKCRKSQFVDEMLNADMYENKRY
ncbi:MAG: ATP-dependent helicase, partial [Lachnospiraceae bacterium]|nr:ATP-dependent helicase [Lachnospiraceae bacterium]